MLLRSHPAAWGLPRVCAGVLWRAVLLVCTVGLGGWGSTVMAEPALKQPNDPSGVVAAEPVLPTSAMSEFSASAMSWLAPQLNVQGDEVQLSAVLPFVLPEPVTQALHKGIAVHFITEVELRRPRWWWRDQLLATASRHHRLSYQPLTRRWRLHTSATASSSPQGLGLVQNFSSLDEAMLAMQRLAGWSLDTQALLPTTGAVQLLLRVRIDTSQLPRPLQINALGRTDWNELFVHEATLSAASWAMQPAP